METVETEAESLPFGDESFDLVFGHAILHHVPDLNHATAEFLRVLRSHELEPITDPGSLVAPPATAPLPDTSAGAAEAAAGAPPTATEGGDVEAAGSGAAEGAAPEAGDG